MNEAIRYAVQMKNKDYMKTDFQTLNSTEIVKVVSVDNPIDGDLYRTRSIAERVIKETLNGSGNLAAIYDDENPPIKAVKIQIIINKINT